MLLRLSDAPWRPITILLPSVITRALPEKVPLLLLGAAALMRVVLAMATPAWQSPDEYPHYWVAREIASTGTLPVSVAEFPRYESYQPPLYYAIASFLVRAVPTGVEYTEKAVAPDTGLVLVRLLSAAAGFLTLLVLWKILRDSPALQPDERLAAFAFVAFLPTYVGVTSSVNNDALAILFSALAIRYAMKPDWPAGTMALCGVWMGLALLTKINTFVLLPFLAYRCWEMSDGRRGFALRAAAIVFLPVIAAVLLLVVRNVLQYNSLTAINPGLQAGLDVSAARVFRASRNLIWSFWLAFGRTYRLTPPPAVYLLTVVPLMLLAAWGIVRIWKTHHTLLLPMLCTILVAVAASLAYTFMYPAGVMTSWGKNLYPVLPFIAVLMALGWKNAVRGRPAALPVVGVTVLLAGCVWATGQMLNPGF